MTDSERHLKRITVYTTAACPWCRRAKAYLADNGLEYSEIDIGCDPRGRREMVLMTGQHGVPVIRVGEKAIVGWDEAEFERILGR